jgi:hypothetical protein
LDAVAAFGGDVQLNPNTSRITVIIDDTRLEHVLGSRQFTVNGRAHNLPQASVVVEGMVFAPIAMFERLQMAINFEANRIFGDGLRIVYRNREYALTMPILSMNDEYMYPLRQIAEGILGAAVNWDQNTSMASVALNNRFTSFVIGQNTFIDNGISKNMTPGVIPFIFHNRTYIPIRYIVEPLGYSARFDAALNAIFIE